MRQLALFLLGTLAGNELAVGAFVHPALSKLPDAPHAASAQAVARVYGKYAPFWYGATLLALLVQAWRAPQSQRVAARVSAALMLFVLLFTLLGPVPINNRVSAWNLDALPDNWKSERERWDKMHAFRTLLLLAAFAISTFNTTRK